MPPWITTVGGVAEGAGEDQQLGGTVQRRQGTSIPCHAASTLPSAQLIWRCPSPTLTTASGWSRYLLVVEVIGVDIIQEAAIRDAPRDAPGTNGSEQYSPSPQQADHLAGC